MTANLTSGWNMAVKISIIYSVWIGIHVSSAGSCDNGWREYGGYCYYIGSRKVTWYEARNECKNKDANLTSIWDKAENNFIKRTKDPDTEYWIGLILETSRDSACCRWSDGSSTSWSLWAGEEPNGSGNCTRMAFGGKWRDTNCNTKEIWYNTPGHHSISFICKKGQSTTTTTSTTPSTTHSTTTTTTPTTSSTTTTTTSTTPSTTTTTTSTTPSTTTTSQSTTSLSASTSKTAKPLTTTTSDLIQKQSSSSDLMMMQSQSGVSGLGPSSPSGQGNSSQIKMEKSGRSIVIPTAVGVTIAVLIIVTTIIVVIVIKRRKKPRQEPTRESTEDNIYSEPPIGLRDPPLEMLPSNGVANGSDPGELLYATSSGQDDPEMSPYGTSGSANGVDHTSHPDVSQLYAAVKKPKRSANPVHEEEHVTVASDPVVSQLYAAVKKPKRSANPVQEEEHVTGATGPEAMYASVDNSTGGRSSPSAEDQNVAPQMSADDDVSQMYAQVKKPRRDSSEIEIHDNPNYASFEE